MTDKPIILRSPQEIYAIRLRQFKIEGLDSGSLTIPVVLSKPEAVMVRAVRDINIDRENDVIMKAGTECILLSIAPSIDAKTGTTRNEKVCQCYLPFWAVQSEEPFSGILADALEVVEAYDDLGNDYSGILASDVYDHMVKKHKDRGIISINDLEEDF